MSNEKIFKEIVSGVRQDWPAKVARRGLWALSKVYARGMAVRNHRYEDEEATTKFPVPVISVGNITVGGTGKTPFVNYVCHLLQEAGHEPAVLSRGYRAKDNSQSIVVSVKGKILEPPAVSGDEPWLLAKKLTFSSVVIGRSRIASAELAVQNLGADYLVLDDGFQHRKLARDLDIVLLDASNPFGYEHVLPRGLLREPLEGLTRADIFVLTKVSQVSDEALQTIRLRLQQIAPHVPILLSNHVPLPLCSLAAWYKGEDSAISSEALPQPVMAVSAIGNPVSFEKTLAAVGVTPVHHVSYEDHGSYTNDTLIDIWKEAFAHGAKAIVVTEKDAVKLADLPESLTFNIPIYVLPIGIEIIDGAELLKEKILALRKG